MRLAEPFLNLPVRFDADTLEREVRALPSSAWVPHPTGFKGNEAVRLITPGGEPTDDLDGEMAPTEYLLACPYIMQIMSEIGAVWGRSRLMGLGAGGEVPLHVDSHYYWRTHWRIHIPVITNPAVTFTCGDQTVHMAAGECWLFDSFRWHSVSNAGTEQRIHLVLDTVGGGRLFDLVEEAQRGDATPLVFAPGERHGEQLEFERINTPKVMSPWEMRAHLGFIAAHAEPHPLLGTVMHRLERFADEWAAAWAQYGTADAGLPTYGRLLEEVKRDLVDLGGAGITLKNKLKLYLVVDHVVFLNAFSQRGEVVDPYSNGMPVSQRLAS